MKTDKITPPITGKIGPYRWVSLSKIVDPETETRLCDVDRHKEETLGVIDFKSDIKITSHLGTHIEGPYHSSEELKDLAELPVDRYIGRAVLLNLDTVTPNCLLTAEQLDAADGGIVQKDDVVVLDSPYHHEPFVVSPDDKRPQLSRESAEWFLEKGVKCVGWGDAVAIENDPEHCMAVHEILMPHDITFLEVMQNLDTLNDRVFMILFTPMPIRIIDSSITNVIALEGVPGFTG